MFTTRVRLFTLMLLSINIIYLLTMSNTLDRFSRVEDFGLLKNVSGVSYYKTTNYDNQIICNKNTVSKIVDEMIYDGYELSKEEVKDGVIDVVLSDNDVTYRLLYFLDTWTLEIYSTQMEKSYIPLTYIHE